MDHIPTLQVEKDSHEAGEVVCFGGQYYWFYPEQWPEQGYWSGGYVGPYPDKAAAAREAETV